MLDLQKGFLSLEKCLSYNVGRIQKIHANNKDKCYW